MPAHNTVLLVDDEPDILAALGETLTLEGYDVLAEGSAEAALRHLSPAFEGTVITDLRMPGADGFELLHQIQQIDARIPLIIITGHGDVPKAVEAMRLGAFDFIEKPVDPHYLIAMVGRAMELRRLALLRHRPAGGRHGADSGIETVIIGHSQIIRDLRRRVLAVAAANVDTLIHGETGTGKELVARCLHDFGPRVSAPFVALNCGALPADTIASELFGHEPGAFTGAVKRRIGKLEYASKGTVFLDEVESLPLNLQTQFLRTLQERVIERLGSNALIPVDFRVIAASKIDLRKAADEGRFREDLLYRLNVAEVHIPPLRRRLDDVPLLFQHFVARAAAARGREPPQVPSSLLTQLAADPWRGNVRELRNRAERFAAGLPDQRGSSGETPASAARNEALANKLESFERSAILRAIGEARGNISATARMLGMPRKRLYLRMQKLGIDIGSRPEDPLDG